MYEKLPPTYETCLLKREQRAQGEGDLKTAMAINDEWLKPLRLAVIPMP